MPSGTDEPPPRRDTAGPAALPASRTIEHPVHIVASPYKTGSTSIEKALLALGAGTRPMPHTTGMVRPIHDDLRAFAPLIREAADAHAFIDRHGAEVRERLSDFTARLLPFDIFADAPFGHAHIHPFIRKALAPRARFIWVDRAFGDWIASVRNWEITHPDTYPDHGIWETDPKARRRELRRYRRSRLAGFRRLARAFPDDCLELQLETLRDFGRLSAFTGLPDPGVPFPVANARRGEGA